MTSFRIAFKADQFEEDQMMFNTAGDIVSSSGGFSTFIFAVFNALLGHYFLTMRYIAQAQEMHNAAHPERPEMTVEEQKEGVQLIFDRTSSEGVCSLHDQVDSL